MPVPTPEGLHSQHLLINGASRDVFDRKIGLTHARNADFLPRPFELIEQRGDLPRSCATQWVSEGDSAAVGVDLMPHSVIDPIA